MPIGNAHAQYELVIPMESVGDCFTKVHGHRCLSKLSIMGILQFAAHA